ncbi:MULTISPECIES: PqqD family protein [unclassified Halanaerobium]|uniref:PqqD family protein n=1 Tax=unclassified Halanaerobium TaxID=2641197 RepID=UPI000DF2AB86|nr:MULTISPECIES: PqqD family protein [unclassified Halanaerobium]RCW48163.1 coenzyme PQQ synthesis protein D (PqqD) [Halanaerobium sp. MA284_MarDTE_T2]RCW80425.1 coenzyme PQQ synthesis protein D (PqqD) [Halanaerobium sp. DL-01]
MAKLFNKKAKGNLYEMIPQKKENIEWKKDYNNELTLIIKRTKWIDRLFQKIFNTPKQTTLELDALGSFVWKQCDGHKTIAQIAKKLRKEYPQKSSPVESRLITFIRILKNNGLIKLYPGK